MGCVCLGRRARSAGQGLPQPRSRPIHHLVPSEPEALSLRADEGGRGPGASERPWRLDGPRAESRGGLPRRSLDEREIRPDRDRLPLHRRTGGRLLLDVPRRLAGPHGAGRRAAILEPASGADVRRTGDVRGKTWQPNPFVHFYVNDVWISGSQGTPSGNFTVAWSSNDWSEGTHRLRVVVQAMDAGELVTR